MSFQSEGIRHIEINKKSNYDSDNFESDDNDDVDETNSYSSSQQSSSNSDEDSDKSESEDEVSNSSKSDIEEKGNTVNEESDKDIEDEKEEEYIKPKKSVNFDSLLKAVIEINDKIEDKERQLKALGDTKNKHYKKGSKSNPGKKTRPRTAVLEYRDESEYSSFDGNESDSESHVSMNSRASSSIRKRPQSSVPSLHGSSSTSRMNMSFSNEKVKSIDKENQRLLKQLLHTKMSAQKPAIVRKKAPQARVQSASSINRNKRQLEIERENLRLLGKLQNVKPSSGITRTTLLSDHSKHEQFSGRIGRSSRPVSAISASHGRRPFSGRSSSSKYFDDSASMMSASSTSSKKSNKDRLTKGNLERQRNWNDRW